MMTIALHSRLIGRPGRLQGLKQCVYVLRPTSCVLHPPPWALGPGSCLLLSPRAWGGLATRRPR
jgi:hypothetical protein